MHRVPGNFHIQMGSRLHNINPVVANLSHIVNSLSFGPVLPKSAINRLKMIPKDYFDLDSTEPMNGNLYANSRLHQSFHHYIKVVPTNVDPGSKNNILAYQLVQTSQIMLVSSVSIFVQNRAFNLICFSIVPNYRSPRSSLHL